MQAEVQARLIRAAQRGDQDAFGRLYQEYKAFVFRYIRQLLGGDQHLAEDLTAETFIKVMRALPRYQSANFRAWLATIALNVVRDNARSKKRQPEVLVEELFHHQDEFVPSAEVAALARAWKDSAVFAALGTLEGWQREPIVLIDLMGMTIAEAAQFLGQKQATVRSRRSKGMSALRERLSAA